MSRLATEMQGEANSMMRLAAGYQQAGERELARKASFAAQALTAAINAVSTYQQAARDAAGKEA